METPASVHRHPIHTMLVALPIGLWVFSFACDLAVVAADTEPVANLWFTIAWYAMLGGLAGALLAAIPGFIDWWSLTDKDLRQLATAHMTINLLVIATYAVNLWIRAAEPPSLAAAMSLSGLGLAMLAFSGWIGGEMVHVHGVGVAAATRPAEAQPAELRLAEARPARPRGAALTEPAPRIGRAFDYETR